MKQKNKIPKPGSAFRLPTVEEVRTSKLPQSIVDVQPALPEGKWQGQTFTSALSNSAQPCTHAWAPTPALSHWQESTWFSSVLHQALGHSGPSYTQVLQFPSNTG